MVVLHINSDRMSRIRRAQVLHTENEQECILQDLQAMRTHRHVAHVADLLVACRRTPGRRGGFAICVRISNSHQLRIVTAIRVVVQNGLVKGPCCVPAQHVACFRSSRYPRIVHTVFACDR